nr:major capsid protein [Eubacteriales bacterium]
TGNAATSDPIGDLMTAVEHMKEQKGVTPTEVLMNSTTYKAMLSSASIKKAMNPLGYANIIPTRSAMLQFIQQETGLTIILYDKMFKDEQAIDRKFFPDGYVTLLPGYAVGNTWYGTTPEEFDLMSGATNASVSIVNTGIAVTTIKEPHPVNVQTIVSEIVLPSFERMDDIYIIKAF